MTEEKEPEVKVKKDNILIWTSWLATLLMASFLISILLWQPNIAKSMAEMSTNVGTSAINDSVNIPREALESMPEFVAEIKDDSLLRDTDTHTEVDYKLRTEAISYTVESGDSVFSIASKFDISPESLLWSNYDVLADDPHSLAIDQVLKIPPTNGIWYQWKANDTVESVAARYKVDPNDILLWFGNELDITNPVIKKDTYVMVPGGQREFQQWVVPTIARGPAGVSTNILGPGSCDTSGIGAYGTGTFVWPASNHYISGNDYWSGHLAIDIAAGMGAPIYAADSGMVVYAGWITGGYGNMVMVDHGNGYQTLYAHLSSISTFCGASVYQGSIVGFGGSTGNSTGPHLHFEVRYLGGFINPWTVLP